MFKNIKITSLALCLTFAPVFGHAAEATSETPKVTAEDQAKSTTGETEITRKIRQDLVADGRLSTEAKNVQIITLDRAVTLRGQVKSNAEERRVLRAAKKQARGLQINNELKIVR